MPEEARDKVDVDLGRRQNRKWQDTKEGVHCLTWAFQPDHIDTHIAAHFDTIPTSRTA